MRRSKPGIDEGKTNLEGSSAGFDFDGTRAYQGQETCRVSSMHTALTILSHANESDEPLMSAKRDGFESMKDMNFVPAILSRHSTLAIKEGQSSASVTNCFLPGQSVFHSSSSFGQTVAPNMCAVLSLRSRSTAPKVTFGSELSM